MSEHFSLAAPLSDRDSWTPAQWCTMERALDLVGTRSAMTLLREAFYGATRFDELARRAGTTPAVTSQRLRTLVDDGLLERRPYQEPGRRHRDEYVLTPLGMDVFPIIAALSRLGEQLPSTATKSVTLTHAGCGSPVAAEVRCAEGHVVTPGDVVVSMSTSPPHS